MKLGFKRLAPNAHLPEYAHEGDSGMDVKSVEYRVIHPGGHALIKTGLAADIPEGYEIQVRPRSGLSAKYGIQCSWGTVDCGYKGEICVNLFNYGCEAYEVKAGDKIAQFVIAPVTRVEVVEVADVGTSERGDGGFGSTGK